MELQRGSTVSGSGCTVPQADQFSSLLFELKLDILDYIPDLHSLKSLVHADPAWYYTFRSDNSRILTQVLINELPAFLYTHAVVAHQGDQGSFVMPNLDNIDINDIADYVAKIPRARDAAARIRLTPASALSIAKTHRKVQDLANHFMLKCAYAREQVFPALLDSLQRSRPSQSEMQRTCQAIYLFHILGSLAKILTIKKSDTHGFYSDYYFKILEMQSSLTRLALAPWEMYQVIGVQAFFRRALHGFGRDVGLSERTMPHLLSYGIDFLHTALCNTPELELDAFLEPYETDIINLSQHAFGMVLSRGAGETWTRKPPQPSLHKPFWPSNDANATGTWENIEWEQLLFYRPGVQGNDLLDHFLQQTEGRLDLWSAALWDKERWKDIHQSFLAPESEWKGIIHHGEPMTLGFQIIRHPGAFLQGW